MLYIYTGVGKQTLHRLCRPRGGVLTLTDPRGGHFLNWPTGTLWSADRADSADVVYTHAACILIIDDDDDDIIRDYLAIIAISLSNNIWNVQVFIRLNYCTIGPRAVRFCKTTRFY